MTIKCLKGSVPSEVPGIAFLSGGQSEEEATANLNSINLKNDTNFVMTYSYGRALQQSALKFWSKDINNIKGTQDVFDHRAKMCSLASQGKWSENIEKNKYKKKFIYLISPTKIASDEFYFNLNKVLKTKKVIYFQLRLKKYPKHKILIIGKKIKNICLKNKVKLIINDDPLLAKKIGADGCHWSKRHENS